MEAFRCSIGGRDVRAERGSFAVPELRADPRSPTIRLSWARLRTDAVAPAAPLVYLAEGPGVPSLADLERPQRLQRWLPFLVSRDVLLLDQRGCGLSGRDLRWRLPGLPPSRFFADEAVALGHILEMCATARRGLAEVGARLEGYTARESARDVIDWLDRLECPRVVLAGFSYGAQLGVELLRRAPERIERAVLSGVEGPADAVKLPLQSDAYLARLSERRARGEDPVAMFVAACERLDRDPLRVRVRHRRSGEEFPLVVGSFGFALLLCRELHATRTLRRLPSILQDTAHGEGGDLAAWVTRHAALALRVDGMPWLVDGASGATPQRWAVVREQARTSRFGNAMNFPLPDAARAWGAPDLGDSYRESVACDVPTLFLSGEFDWNAPVEQAASLARRFRGSHHALVKNAVHEQMFTHPAAVSRAAAFLDGRPVEGSAAVELPDWIRAD